MQLWQPFSIALRSFEEAHRVTQKPNLYDLFNVDDPTLSSQIALLDLAAAIRLGLSQQPLGFQFHLKAGIATELVTVIESYYSEDRSR